MKKKVVSVLMICGLLVMNFVFTGCGGKKEESFTDKVIKVAGEEIKGRITGDVRNIAEYGFKYDHEALAAAVNSPKNQNSKVIAQKVKGQIERSIVNLMLALKKNGDFDKIYEAGNSINFGLRLKRASNQGTDLSEACLLIGETKYLAFILVSRIKDSVSIVCDSLSNGASTDTINGQWNEVLKERKALQNLIDGKPVILKLRF